MYIEADGDYIVLHTLNNRYIINLTMRTIEDVLGKTNFARIHRSYIVAIKKIERIVDNKVYIKGKKIPIGTAYRNDFLNSLNIL